MAHAHGDALLNALSEQAALCRDVGTMWVGFSGGMDSTALLHALAAWRDANEVPATLKAIHAHHGLHPDADAWAAHCAQQAAALNVSCAVERVHVAKDDSRGVEAAARAARYQAFAKHVGAGDVLFLAHHLDDQLTTVLMRFLRGLGTHALRGMTAMDDAHGFRVCRPFLAQPRTALLAYAQSHELAWVDDPANDDERHDRVFVEQNLLPQLRQRWHGLDAKLLRSASVAESDGAYLQRQARFALNLCDIDVPDQLDARLFMASDAALHPHMIRLWCADGNVPEPPASCLDGLNDLLHAAEDRQPMLTWQGHALRRFDGKLWLGVVHPSVPADWSLTWDGVSVLDLPHGLGRLSPETWEETSIPWQEATAPYTIRLAKGGDKIQLPHRNHRTLLSEWQRVQRTPPWLRARTVVWVDEVREVVWPLTI